MKSSPVILILLIILSTGCRKSTEPVVWEKNWGPGNALFIKATADSGIIACGGLGGKPFLTRLGKNKNKLVEYSYPDNGSFSSLWNNNSYTIATGNSNGKMLLACVDIFSNLLWDTTLNTGFNVANSSICYLGNRKFAAIGSTGPDSSSSVVTGIMCVWFDADGTITAKRYVNESSSFFANNVGTDNSGNFFTAMCRKISGAAPRATVAKFNSEFQKIWETELYNNPGFSSSGNGITLDNSGNIYVSGKTELSSGSGSIDNTFTVKLDNSGSVKWKKYLESSNSGASVIIDKSDQLLILNRNCLRINVLSMSDGVETAVIRTFNACDANKTDALGNSFDINYDGNLVIAGSKSGGFYLVMKSPALQVPGQ
jgi:hypothetical protein